MQVVWPNYIETVDDLGNGNTAPRFELEVRWRLDFDKQQWVITVLDNVSNRGIAGYSRAWNGPPGTDIITFGRREPIFQNLVIQGIKLMFVALVVQVVVQLGSLV